MPSNLPIAPPPPISISPRLEAAEPSGPEVRAWIQRPAANAAAAAVLALATWAFFGHAYLGSDQLYALIWGSDLVGGRLPNYDSQFAPTPHPLTVVVGGLASLAGHGSAYDALVILAYLCFGALVWSVFRVGHAAFDWRVGLLAAAVVATSFPILARALSGYLDIPFVALVLAAAVIEIRHPRRGLPVLIVLVIAGLLRPEAWVIAGAYWWYVVPSLDWPRRVGITVLALAAPVLWGAADLLVAGDVARSAVGAREAATSSGLAEVAAGRYVTETFGDLRSILRLPVIAAGIAGLGMALATAPVRARVPAVLLALSVLCFVGLIVLGLPVADRFLFLPGALLAVFAAYGVLGWIARPPGRLRQIWAGAGVSVVVLLVVSAPGHISQLQRLATDTADRQRIDRDLGELTRMPIAARALRDCDPLTIATHHPLALFAYELGRAPETVLAEYAGIPQRGAFVAPANLRVAEVALTGSAARIPRIMVPAGFTPSTRNRSWVLYTRGC